MRRVVFLSCLFLTFTALARPRPSTDCLESAKEMLGEDQILMGYALEGVIEPLIILKGKDFVQASGQQFKGQPQMFRLPEYQPVTYAFGSTFTELKDSGCVWYGKLEKKVISPSLFSSNKIALNLGVTDVMRDTFYSINKDCVNQGDWLPGEKPPCAKPKLLATSDLNGNGRLEYWYTDPYMWEWGFTIAEIDETGKKMSPIVKKCPGCD